MTRDARLSALHRGDFRPGAALPSPALPPDPCSELLAARSSCLAGGVPDLPSPRLRAAAAGRHSPLRLQDRLRKTPLHERGWQNYTIYSLRSQKISSYVARITAPCRANRSGHAHLARGFRIRRLCASARNECSSGVRAKVLRRVTPGIYRRPIMKVDIRAAELLGRELHWHVHGAPGGNHARASFSS